MTHAGHCPTCLRPLASTTPSAEAREAPHVGSLRRQVLEQVVEADHHGATPAEVAAVLGVPLRETVAVFAGLAAGDWILHTSYARGGMKVALSSVSAIELLGAPRATELAAR